MAQRHSWLRLTGAILLSAVSTLVAPGCGERPTEELTEGAAPGEVSSLHSPGSSGPLSPCGVVARQVKDIAPGEASSDPRELVDGDGALVFSADDGMHGREPWYSTGEGRGTKRLKDIRAGAAGSDPASFTRVGDTVFFTADDGVHGRELWKTDGTPSGTKQVKDIREGAEGSAPENLTLFKGLLYFTADDGVHGRELWRSDGTSRGTRLVRDYTSAPLSVTFEYELAVAGDLLYFQYRVAGFALEKRYLARTDGTAEGFVRLLETDTDDSIQSMTAVGSRLFFVIAREGASLFVTDGSPAGTRRVKGISDFLHDLVAFQGALYFASGPDTYEPPPDYLGDELWRSDGTPEGTVLVKDIMPGFAGSEPRELTVFQERLFFSADDGSHGRELWRSDGTEAGTVLVEDFEPGPVGSSPEGLAGYGTRLFLSADTSGRGREPWMHDGTLHGATPLAEINPGPASSDPRDFVLSGWDIFFSADDGRSGRELYALPFRPPAACAVPH